MAVIFPTGLDRPDPFQRDKQRSIAKPPANLLGRGDRQAAFAHSALAHFQHKRAFARWDPQVLADYIAHGTRDETTARGTRRVLSFQRDIETRIYNTLPDHLDRLFRKHPLACPVAFIGGRASREMKQAGMALTEKITQGRVLMLDDSHLVPMEKPVATAAAIEAAVLNMLS